MNEMSSPEQGGMSRPMSTYTVPYELQYATQSPALGTRRTARWWAAQSHPGESPRSRPGGTSSQSPCPSTSNSCRSAVRCGVPAHLLAAQSQQIAGATHQVVIDARHAPAAEKSETSS